eukprot:CAMPEP_0196781018 /NCGR_PEP_ID=MMETSP1104-20130614/9003_1 /TAXON_ID=33652 /ORGANISM="Cafeteria sp., Strain Caron Lab Isolate" /LENGTH=507 /DNA_ID=CAMNT_0042151235 /DNA_START=9 /DNA_END=1532 /DNA_ORIENTATION=+
MSSEAPRAHDLESLEAELLKALSEVEAVDSGEFAQRMGAEHQVVVGVIKSLEADEFVTSEVVTNTSWELLEAGLEVIEKGSPEANLLSHIPEGGIELAELRKDPARARGFPFAMQNKWIAKDKASGLIMRVLDGEPHDVLREELARLRDSGCVLEALPEKSDVGKQVLRRKLARLVKRKSFMLRRGAAYAPQRKKKMADLTRGMLEDGSWATTEFKEYNFRALGQPVSGGYLHPLLKVRTEFRKFLLEMGFEEMPTNRFVESSFWNFDALFQPQSHPARDAHDTFFIKEPATASAPPADYMERVKGVHSHGGYGSRGYGYDWKEEEAAKNLLRTHTTAVSARMLYALGEEYRRTGVFTPKKYFSIDRVFRNETLDATHLAEFHQVEFLVADRNMSLGNLIGLLETFFNKIGITNLRFKPAYNPYTEPSMEVFGFHPDLNKWTEIGNSGVFRPEMLLPMGLPEDVSVIAGGLSVERPTMIKYRIKNIRDLFGHKVDIAMTRSAPVARY